MKQHMQVLKVKSSAIFPVITELLDSGQTARITVTGNSMYPFLRAGRDSVELSKASFQEINRGDIVLIKRTNGIYILHRVIKKPKILLWLEVPSNGLKDRCIRSN